MQTQVAEATTALATQVRFHLMPAYSPKLNIVEYAIHLIRLRVLHHADCRASLAEFQERVKAACENGAILSKEQIINILGYIESLVPQSAPLSPEREYMKSWENWWRSRKFVILYKPVLCTLCFCLYNDNLFYRAF
jgi:hypothetical protein